VEALMVHLRAHSGRRLNVMLEDPLLPGFSVPVSTFTSGRKSSSPD
jgi:hypothetical protein